MMLFLFFVQLESKHTELKFPQYKASIINKPQLIVVGPPLYIVPCLGNLAIEKHPPKEIQRKKGKGECWFCNGKWTRGHKCGLKQLLMLDVVNEEPTEDDEFSELQPEFHHMELSKRAFYGTNAK